MMQAIRDGLNILIRHQPDGYFAAEHDEIFCADQVSPEMLDANERDLLERWGWRWDPSLPAWRKTA